jgi:type II secretory pathway pseudopilin PulG
MTALADCGLRIANRKASHGVYPRGLPGRDKPGRSPRNRDSAIYNRQSAVPVPPAGATLFELVIVMAILAIVAAIAIPRFAGAIQIAALDDAVKRVACDLRLAQANAIKKQQQQNVTFDVTNNRYELVGMPNPDHPAASYIVSLTEPPYPNFRT